MENYDFEIVKAIDKNTAAIREATAVERQRNELIKELIEVLKDD